MTRFEVRLYEAQKLQTQLTFDDTVIIGRQEQFGPPPFESCDQDGEPGLVVAEHADKAIPRRWFRLSCNPQGQLQIDNLHRRLNVVTGTGVKISAGETRLFDAEVLIALGPDRAMRVGPLTKKPEEEPSSSAPSAFRSLGSMPPTPGSRDFITNTMTLRQFSQPNGQAVVDLLRLALQVVQKAANSDAFFQAATDAACEIVALDRAIVILRESDKGSQIISDSWVPDDWFVVAERIAPGIAAKNLPRISQNMIHDVVRDTLTKIHDPTQSEFTPTQSLQNISCVVASPILDDQRKVIGVLYGDRWTQQGGFEQMRITDLEATLVEVLASTVAGGVARTVEENHRNILAGHFSSAIAEKLITNPELMDGQDAEVSVLFCDIRGFSTVTEKLGAKKTIQWINDVLSELTQCVVDTDGVLVDYVGDELLAMWGAPVAQPDHARRAVDAALAMLAAIEVLRERWADILPQRFGAGIGVNTGTARVGNVGSQQRFKYGVLGNIVNVGSRLQAATKQLGVHCMISEATAQAAACEDTSTEGIAGSSDESPEGPPRSFDWARRLAKLSVVGIEQPVDVYQLVHQPPSDWQRFCQEYEAALADFEELRFGEATRRLGELMQTHPGDRPCKLLLSKAVNHLDEPIDGFSPVWELTQK